MHKNYTSLCLITPFSETNHSAISIVELKLMSYFKACEPKHVSKRAVKDPILSTVCSAVKDLSFKWT